MTRFQDDGLRTRRRPLGRLIALLVLIWLIIGVIAAAQRQYFSGSSTSCAKVGTIAITIIAGPLNYVGVNPRLHCKVPRPSK